MPASSLNGNPSAGTASRSPATRRYRRCAQDSPSAWVERRNVMSTSGVYKRCRGHDRDTKRRQGRRSPCSANGATGAGTSHSSCRGGMGSGVDCGAAGSRRGRRPNVRAAMLILIRAWSRSGSGWTSGWKRDTGCARTRDGSMSSTSGTTSRARECPAEGACRSQRRRPTRADHAESGPLGGASVGSSPARGGLDRRSGGGVAGDRAAAGGGGLNSKSVGSRCSGRCARCSPGAQT
jgi:hypothetical protein